jgi:hypothetical protein
MEYSQWFLLPVMANNSILMYELRKIVLLSRDAFHIYIL